jgi:tryptophan halogenase
MIKNKIQEVVIVGNGYLPYLTALCIQKKFRHSTPKLLIVDLGKPSQPELLQSLGSMKLFHADLELSEVDFVKRTQAEINLGFDYSGFAEAKGAEIFTDTQYGFDLQNRRFSYLFNKLKQTQPDEILENYCLSAKMARIGRFTPPSPKTRSLYASINYGYRLTAEAYGKFLAEKLSASDVKIVHSAIEGVNLNEEGCIGSIKIIGEDGITGDFFIDASEARILTSQLNPSEDLIPLYPETLALEFSHSASPQSELKAYSHITASRNSLQMNGTYLGQTHQTSISLSEDSTLNMGQTKGFIDRAPWIKNCLALGRAFTNRTSILIDNSHINQTMLLRLLDLWPRSTSMEMEARAYNTNTLAESKHIIDMDHLHLAMALKRPKILSDAMRYKLDTFKQSGKLAYYEKELLQEQQWPVLFNALGVMPDITDLSVRNCADQWLTQELFRIKSTLAKAAEAAPLYQDFIDTAHR